MSNGTIHEKMTNSINRLGRMAVAVAMTWATVALIHRSPATNRSIAAMTLLMEVLAISTLGDRGLAVVASLAAALNFSWYYGHQAGTPATTTAEGVLTSCVMTLTALTGSHLAIRAQVRAAEAIRRRQEMEQLHQLGTALVASSSVAGAARRIVDNLVTLFVLNAAKLTIAGEAAPYLSGAQPAGDCTVVRSDDNRYVLELYGTPPSEEVRIALHNLIDLVLDLAASATQKARLEAAERGEEFRITVLNSLAHNFKTPLTSIKAAASLLRGSLALQAEDAREMATVIDEEADRLDQMIRESLELARIEAHQASPRLEACSLGTVVETVAARVLRVLGSRRLSVEIPDDLPYLLGDRFLLEQMLIQVLDNAWKYSQPGALIRVTAGSHAGGLFLEVLNEGGQIPPEDRERIFSRFFRGSSSSSQVEGTGMGLPIAKSIVEAHAGELTLQVRPEGPAFRFTFPPGVPPGPEIRMLRLDSSRKERSNDTEPQHSHS